MRKVTGLFFTHFHVLLVLPVLFAMSATGSQSHADSIFITSAESTLSTSDTPPYFATDWRSIPLPRSWTFDERHPEDARKAWYRMAVPEQAVANGWNHLLILRHMLNLELWLDETYLGSAGPVSDPAEARLQRNWNRPVIWVVPQHMMTADKQYFYFRLHSEPGFGVMSPVFFGNEEAIQQRYSINYFLQIDLVKISLLAMLLIGSLSLFIWLRTRQNKWWIIGLMSMSWSLPLSYILVPSTTIGEFVFLRLSHWGTVAGAVFLLAFIYSYYLQVSLRKLRWLALIPVIHGVFLVIIADLQVVTIGSIGQALCQFLFLLLIYQLLRSPRRRDGSVLAIIAGLVVMLLAATHDISLVSSGNMARWRWDMPISYITQPILLLIIAWQGVKAFINSVDELEKANRKLREKLTEAEEDIKQVFAKQERLETEIRIEAERELVYRDLHDDLGARLLSLVFQSEKGFAQDLARTALQDLRDIVSRVMAGDQMMTGVFADCMAEQLNRANSLQKTLDWELDPALDDYPCANRTVLSLRLLVREMVGCCLRLAELGSLFVNVRTDPDGAVVMELHYHAEQPLRVSPLLERRLKTLQARLDTKTAANNAILVTVVIPEQTHTAKEEQPVLNQ